MWYHSVAIAKEESSNNSSKVMLRWYMRSFLDVPGPHQFCELSYLANSSQSWYTVAWWQLWNFIVKQMKFNRFLHSNEHPERICLYLVRQLDYELSKVGHFQISKSIFEVKCKFSFLKLIFSFEYWIRRTTFIKSIYIFHQSHKTLFSKNVPYFCRLVIKLSYKIQTNPLRMFIWNQKSIEFHLPP